MQVLCYCGEMKDGTTDKDKTAFRSICPVTCTLDIIGDKWTMVIIRDFFAGKTHFKEFMSSPEKVATNILTSRIKKLEEFGIIEKFPSPEVKGKFAYKLTKRGCGLLPVLKSLRDWGLENVPGTVQKMKVRISETTQKKSGDNTN